MSMIDCFPNEAALLILHSWILKKILTPLMTTASKTKTLVTAKKVLQRFLTRKEEKQLSHVLLTKPAPLFENRHQALVYGFSMNKRSSFAV